MASTINADDGAISGSAGVKTSADNSGILELQSNGTTQFTLGSSSVVINEAGADVDFRVEGDTDPNLFVVDASTDRVGVGTNAPAVKFDIVGGGAAGQLSLSTNATDATTKEGKLVVRHYTNSEENFMVLYPFSTATDNSIYYGGGSASQNAATGHFWATAANNTTTSGTVRMTLNSAGNLGLGVTPSAWGSIFKAVQVGTGGSIFGRASGNQDVCLVGANLFWDGSNWKYIASLASTRYEQATGIHAWFNAPSGTAGNTISFTQAMTLDASGRLLVGTTSSTYQVDITTSGNNGLRLQDGTNQIYLGWTGGNAATGTLTNVPYTFVTNGTERARITAGGDFWVGTSSSIAPAGVTASNAIVSGTSNFWSLGVRNTTSSAPWGIAVEYSGAAPNNTSNTFLYCYDNTPALRASIRSNGGLANYQSNNTDLSDERTKKDITPAPSYWDKIGALEIVTYKYNDQTHDDVNVGVIAQQVETVEPVWVENDGWDKETPEGEEPLKTVYTKDITFAAIKALQEAMTRIEELEAKVAALESK